MKNPLVSVIVPTYNRAYCLNRAVESVLEQTYPKCEVVIVDDGSTDNTAQTVKDRFGSNENVKYLSKKNGGVSSARNAGFKAALGACIALLDSDDVWKKRKIESQVAVLNALPQVGMVWSDMEAVDPQGNVLQERYLRTMYRAYRWYENGGLFTEHAPFSSLAEPHPDPGAGTEVYWGNIFSQMVMGNLVHTSTVLLTRDRLEKVQGFNEDLRVTGEDYDFHLRTCREGPVAYIDATTISYQVGGPDQLTHPSLTLHMAENFLKTIEPVIERDRERIQLPDSMIRSVLSEAHAWIGKELLKSGRNAEARRSLTRAARLLPGERETWLWLAATCLPKSAHNLAKRAYRRLHSSGP
jgi:glycosyltransferase involved in cell wall biosynthesis